MIRPARPEDFEDLFYLQHICYLKPCSREELKHRLLGPSWVACFGQNVVGAIICTDVNWIWSLTVAPPYRRRGLANKLMAKAEEHFAGQEIHLRVESTNPAKHLYESRGYATRQTIKDFYGAGYDAVEMAKT